MAARHPDTRTISKNIQDIQTHYPPIKLSWLWTSMALACKWSIHGGSWWLFRCFPMFSHVFQCVPMFSISMRVGRRPLEGTKACNLGAWASRSRTPRIFTRQGSDRAGKCPNFTTASIYAGWWFGTCFIFPYIGNNHPNWLTNIFQRGWNHQPVYIYMYIIWDYMSMCILYVNCIYIYIYMENSSNKKTKCPMSEMSIAICFISRRLSTELGAYWKGA